MGCEILRVLNTALADVKQSDLRHSLHDKGISSSRGVPLVVARLVAIVTDKGKSMLVFLTNLPD